MDTRRRVRAAAAALSLLVLAACSNDPAAYPHGEQRASSTDGSVLQTVAIYVLAPALILGVLAAAAWLPGAVRNRRYRPTEGWNAEPVWFAGPSQDPVEAVERASAGDVTRGGSGGSW